MEQLRKLRKEKQLYQKDVAAYLGIDRTTYVKYETGASQPDHETLARLADYFGVTVDYLLGREELPHQRTPIPKAVNIMPLPKTKKVPLIGTIACGTPIYADENIEEYLTVPEDIDADFCLHCKGDSMIGARIHNGDIVYIRAQEVVDNGQIAAVLIDDEATLKRVYISPGKITLAAANDAFEPLVYVGPETEQVRIIGRAVAFLSRVR